MMDILFKIYFEAFYWENSLLSLGFSCAPCVAPEWVLCEVSSNTRSWEVTGRMFITLNARYLFTLMLILVWTGKILHSVSYSECSKFQPKPQFCWRFRRNWLQNLSLIVNCMLFLLCESLIVLQSCYTSIFFEGELIDYS